MRRVGVTLATTLACLAASPIEAATIRGTQHNDTITGTKQADTIYGLDTATQSAVPTLRAGAVGLRAFAVPAAFEYLAVYVDP